MTSDRIRKLAQSVVKDPIIEEDVVVEHNRVLFDQPVDTEVQKALKQWDRGKDEERTNEERMDEIQKHPEYDELGSLSQTMAEDRET